MIISFFDAEGRFAYTVEGDPHFVIQPTIAASSLGHVEGQYDDNYWLYGGAPRQRPPCPAVLDGLTLRHVRPGSAITINGTSYDCPDGGDVELEFTQPGTYRVVVVRWPYLDGEFTIEN